jgi:hypothetical protein
MSFGTICDRLIEFVALSVFSGIAGFSIGVPQHYIAFGLHGWGFGRDAFFLACLEGGIVGVMLGIPTGLIAYYLIFRRDVTFKQGSSIFLGSLLGGCGVGAIGGPWSALLTPALTVAIARGLNEKRWTLPVNS